MLIQLRPGECLLEPEGFDSRHHVILLTMPQQKRPVADHPQEIRRDQTQGLQRMGTVSALVRGSPDDAIDEIRAKAVAAKADYYVILMVDETVVTGQWYSQAILYRQ